MPDGVIVWIDGSLGQAGVERDGHSYVASLSDVQSRARHVGARVHFDIQRVEGAETAVEVDLRRGQRASKHHQNFGTLAGAHDPGVDALDRYSRRHPEFGRRDALHPLQVVAAWGRHVASADLDAALSLYGPGAVLHLQGVSLASRRHIRSQLPLLPVFASGRLPAVRGAGELITARWSLDEGSWESRFRLSHGLISEQWIGPPTGESVPAAVQTSTGTAPLETTTQGDVAADDVEYAIRRLGVVMNRVEEPILLARVKLSLAADPARSRPAIARASLNVNGRFLGAHVAAHNMAEAVDLLEQRLADQIEHRSQRIEALRRHGPGPAAPGEWRHADLPASRPEYFERPPDERQLVRHKAFTSAEQSVEEAIFDMEQADYDFYLFRDLASGQDSVVERLDGDAFRLQHLQPVDVEPAATIYAVVRDDRPASALSVAAAVELLAGCDDRFVFFSDVDTGRGCVLYRRYDGHYGLITLG